MWKDMRLIGDVRLRLSWLSLLLLFGVHDMTSSWSLLLYLYFLTLSVLSKTSLSSELCLASSWTNCVVQAEWHRFFGDFFWRLGLPRPDPSKVSVFLSLTNLEIKFYSRVLLSLPSRRDQRPGNLFLRGTVSEGSATWWHFKLLLWFLSVRCFLSISHDCMYQGFQVVPLEVKLHRGCWSNIFLSSCNTCTSYRLRAVKETKNNQA